MTVPEQHDHPTLKYPRQQWVHNNNDKLNKTHAAALQFALRLFALNLGTLHTFFRALHCQSRTRTGTPVHGTPAVLAALSRVQALLTYHTDWGLGHAASCGCAVGKEGIVVDAHKLNS
ncbi:hypothetical protein HRR83_006560 [Exophiala dermatitidis]|uniref:Uncharacterized protein n=1 Tax=Exophiala dermatitidis TaxID=5970 RepID=A0AAN6IU07_EXODE|nr:hypothetical protein HRR74_005720 [Exophiala dermatitidis]KAJ4515455.1 hypothetical protein HRR73_005287 [Exophiala dermatitidis]KAJ4536487.1 hypothetical protein HRR77_007404 [Exophiala dermatitidis]KAJ4540984.1 hypothetical protein HRR76_004366 [Exophiala dermatitidis]KAJ4569804.1 hypothetical protein HRR81_006279 [Exophiala dermatitidis]